ncbi:MAG: phytanoyl-CoA dioxygenase family protein [Flavobacterium sp.]|nr:phytanoyl-CoA dioxygenase family protein [Flavobacterium sp.]
MYNYQNIAATIANKGFATVEAVCSSNEIDSLLQVLAQINSHKANFKKTTNLFAIRQFLKEVPTAIPLIFTPTLTTIISEVFGNNYFVVKSIYFDKPSASNWFVAYHQDLTISVDKKREIQGFSPYTVKQNQFAVQPPLIILEDNFTIRIHLDDTDANNGALKVIAQSHLKGIYKAQTINWAKETEVICPVKKGGIMLMKPLLLHASNKTTNQAQRRVIHVEFSRIELPEGLNWSERLNYTTNA